MADQWSPDVLAAIEEESQRSLEVKRGMRLLCDQPGGCSPSCRPARLRGDDMSKWADFPNFDFLDDD